MPDPQKIARTADGKLLRSADGKLKRGCGCCGGASTCCDPVRYLCPPPEPCGFGAGKPCPEELVVTSSLDFNYYALDVFLGGSKEYQYAVNMPAQSQTVTDQDRDIILPLDLCQGMSKGVEQLRARVISEPFGTFRFTVRGSIQQIPDGILPIAFLPCDLGPPFGYQSYRTQFPLCSTSDRASLLLRIEAIVHDIPDAIGGGLSAAFNDLHVAAEIIAWSDGRMALAEWYESRLPTPLELQPATYERLERSLTPTVVARSGSCWNGLEITFSRSVRIINGDEIADGDLTATVGVELRKAGACGESAPKPPSGGIPEHLKVEAGFGCKGCGG